MTDTLQQDDLMTQLLAHHPQVGRLAWFTVEAQDVDQSTWLNAVVQAGLAHYGMPQGVAPTTAYLRSLRLLQHAAESKTLIRRVVRERGRTVHHWIRETLVNGQVDFTVLAAIDRDTKHDRIASVYRMALLSRTEEEALSQLPEFLNTARHTYTPGDRRRQVRAWFTGAGALHLDAAGPVQFVPEEAAGLLEALTQARDALGIQVWSMPLQRSEDVIATITQSLDAEVTKKTATLLKQVQDTQAAGKSPTVAQQAKLVATLQDLDTRVQRYAGLFGQQLTTPTSQLDLAKQAVRQALTA